MIWTLPILFLKMIFNPQLLQLFLLIIEIHLQYVLLTARWTVGSPGGVVDHDHDDLGPNLVEHADDAVAHLKVRVLQQVLLFVFLLHVAIVCLRIYLCFVHFGHWTFVDIGGYF